MESLRAQPVSSASQVTVSTVFASDSIVAGSDARLAVILRVNEGWHVNSHHPTSDYLIGTTFDLEPKEGFIVIDLQYPKGKIVHLSFSEQSLDVYEGKTTFYATLRVSRKARLGNDTLKGAVRLQACDDQVCLAPSSLRVSVPVTVVSEGSSVRPVHGDVFSAYAQSKPGGNALKNDLAVLFDQKGSLVAFLAIFLVGLALNLTPCVYPMLSVTVSLFGTQAETSLSRGLAKAIVYVLGIATMYSVLGVAAALGGGLFGSWLQSPWVLGGIALLLFALAMSSFGLYQIQVPYWITSRIGGTTGTGMIGLYLSGLVVGVFAAPCIGPPVIALLTLVGTRGDPVFGFWAFFVLSLGLGFPYLILGTFSGLIKKIPRSGAWLVWVERIFAVVLSGASLFYLSLAVTPKFAPYVVPFTLLVGGTYLGFLEPSGRDRRAQRRVQRAFGTACIILGLYTANSLRETGITWEPYTETKLLDAKKHATPVVMDFYADWCIPCLELDRNTFTDRDVERALRDVTRLKVDLTHFDSPEAEALRKQYDISGVPTVVFLRRDGSEDRESRIVGFLPATAFLEKFKAAITPLP